MKKLYLALLLASLTINVCKAQKQQYFDGNDTFSYSLKIHLDTSSTNVWQIGPPQKKIFNRAVSPPNVLVTDTINNYPSNISSSFQFHYSDQGVGIRAIRFAQKLDLVSKHDGGFIEYSTDSGMNWHTVFDNPYVYNLYGFDTTNVDSVMGQLAFTGTDTNWRDVWLCFDGSYFRDYKDVLVRFTIKSDTIDTGAHEGWMLDNMQVYPTIMHTVKKTADQQYLKVYPTNTTGRVHIEAEKLPEYHIIEYIQLINTEGRVVQEFGKCPTKFFIDIGHHPAGAYFLKVKTNKKTTTSRIFLNR